MLDKLADPNFWQSYFSNPLPHLGLGLLAQGRPGLATGLQSFMNFAQAAQAREQQKLLNELRQQQIEAFRLEKQRLEDIKTKEAKLNEYFQNLVPKTLPADPAAARTAKEVADGIFGTDGPIIGLERPNPQYNSLVGMFPYLPDEVKAEMLKSMLPVQTKPFVAPAGSAVFGLPGRSEPFMVPEKTRYMERMVPISPTTQQMQVSYDGGVTWTNVGTPRPIHAPPIQVVSMGSPLPIPDPNSPTGYSYAQFPNRPGVPYQNTGVPAPAPPGNKPPAEVSRMNIALEALDKALDAYERELKTFNPRNPLNQADPTKRAKLASLYGDVMLQMKEAQALGALQEADLKVMGRVLTDPTSAKGAYYGVQGLMKQIEQGRDFINRRRAATETIYPSGQPIKVPSTVTVGGVSYKVLRALPGGRLVVDVNGRERVVRPK